MPPLKIFSVLALIALLCGQAENSCMRGLRLAACGVAIATVALVAIAVLQTAGVLPNTTADEIPLWLTPFLALAVLVPTTVGLLIAIRRPRNVIAWILLLGPPLSLPPLELVLSEGWALQLGRATWPVLYAWPIAIAYVFPDGRLLSRRWRWVAGAAVASFVGFMTLAMLDPGPFAEPHASVPNPLAGNAIGEWVAGTGASVPFWLGILASLFAGVLAIVLRLRRSSGIERLQVLWLAWVATLIPLGLLVCIASWMVFDFVEEVVFPFLLVMQAMVALAIGVAVARYRLYAIERLINRTLVYALLSACLGGAYIGTTLVLGVALGHDSAWVTAGATLAAALAFRPLRSLVQDAVDRRFSRARYDALRQVETFEQEVRENRRAPEEIGRVLARSLSDPLAELLFWLPESETYAGSTGKMVPGLPEDGRARSEVHRDGARTAVLLHDPALLERRELLDSVLSAATLSIEIARLRVEVRLQLAEVQASRTRIVEAGYEERRRLERDLHDGAQQRLVSLGLRLRRMQRSLPREAQILSPALDQTVAEVAAAIGDLRQIAAGVRPARLDEGLAAALRDLARTAPIPVDVEAPIGRVAASVEAAAYYVACEAITNAVKHASASKVALRAVRENGTLVVTVADDGVGGAVAHGGSGLAGLKDRVAAHGGRIEVASPEGRGTRIEVAIPCES